LEDSKTRSAGDVDLNEGDDLNDPIALWIQLLFVLGGA
jgi:hypothetical protein